MFPGKLKTNHIGGVIKEPIKLLVTKWNGMLLKQIAGLTEVSYEGTFLFLSSFLSLNWLLGVGKGYVTRKLPKLYRFHGIL